MSSVREDESRERGVDDSRERWCKECKREDMWKEKRKGVEK